MLESQKIHWTKEGLRSLRLRLGWSKSELAHHLNCGSDEVESWELGQRKMSSETCAQLEFILRQAEARCDEVLHTPAAEQQCASKALAQIEFTRVKADLE